MQNNFGSIISVNDPASYSIEVAEIIIEKIKNVLSKKQNCAVALSGGNTPIPIFELLGTIYLNALTWQKVHFFWIDERCVAPTHAESNYGKAYEYFLCKIKNVTIYRIPAEKNPDAAASEYEEQLISYFYGTPKFDLGILGMGDDGHVASIFPKSEIQKEKNKFVAAEYIQKLNSFRISLTYPVLNNIKTRIFLLNGESKKILFNKLFLENNSYSAHEYPILGLFPNKNENIFIIS